MLLCKYGPAKINVIIINQLYAMLSNSTIVILIVNWGVADKVYPHYIQ